MSKLARQPDANPQLRDDGQEHPLFQAVAAVQDAEKLRLAGKLDRARATCAKVLKQYPDYVAALHTMGLILADQRQYDKAIDYLHRASMHNPNDPKTLTALSGVYLKLGSKLMAARTLEQAQQVAPNDANILATLGEIYREEKEYELSKDAFEAALKIDPSFAHAEIGLAHCLDHIGQLAEATKIFERKVYEGSRSISFLYTLSQMPASLVSLDLVSLVDEAMPPRRKPVGDDFSKSLAFTKAAVFDRAGRFEEAWVQVCQARRYNLSENRKAYRDLKKRHSPLLEIARTGPLDLKIDADESSEHHPISLFIVGPSRSGKTSLERLVGSLPGVKRGYENPIVENAVRLTFQTEGFPTRSRLIELPQPLGELFRKFYCEERTKRAESAKVLTNTMPVRNEDALKAAVEIPNSRFVFIKRDIDDLTIRVFMKDYARGNYYSSDIGDTREYIKWCHQMMDVVAGRMPHICRVLTYEEMVADPAAALSEVADLCGLDASGNTLPSIGDDRGCGEPYREYIEEVLRDRG